jgi:hypothetical protein
VQRVGATTVRVESEVVTGSAPWFAPWFECPEWSRGRNEVESRWTKARRCRPSVPYRALRGGRSERWAQRRSGGRRCWTSQAQSSPFHVPVAIVAVAPLNHGSRPKNATPPLTARRQRMRRRGAKDGSDETKTSREALGHLVALTAAWPSLWAPRAASGTRPMKPRPATAVPQGPRPLLWPWADAIGADGVNVPGWSHATPASCARHLRPAYPRVSTTIATAVSPGECRCPFVPASTVSKKQTRRHVRLRAVEWCPAGRYAVGRTLS